MHSIEELERITNRALDLGFFPVEIDLAAAGWQLMEKHEGGQFRPSLWLRHVPLIGDEIVFRVGEKHYRGTVAKRAFVTTSAQDLFGWEEKLTSSKFVAAVHLFLDPISVCSHPEEASLWDEEVPDAHAP